MSQPPQSGWGPDQPYGQSSPNGGYGDYGQSQQDGYGQPSPAEGYGGYGQDPSTASPSFGPSFGETEPAAPEKKNTTKIAVIVCAGCAVLALIVAIIGGGIFLFTRDGGESTGGAATTQEEPEEDEPAEEEPTEEEPTEEEPTEEEPTEEAPTEEEPAEEETAASGEGQGSREDPFAANQPFTLDDGEGGEIEVTFGNVDWDATEAIMDANQFNDEPGDGETYILVPVTVTYSGSESVSPSFLLSVSYVAGTGNSYREASAVAPNDSIHTNEIYDGGTEEFDLPFLIPEEAVEDGSFTVSALLDFRADDVWVAAE